jgi:hypothetical protein
VSDFDSAGPLSSGRGTPSTVGGSSVDSLIPVARGAFRSVRSFRSTADRASNIAWFREGTLTIITSRIVSRGVAAAALAVGLSAALAPAARADVFKYTLNGIFNGSAAGITDTISGPGAPLLTVNEPFTMTAEFNSANVVFNFFPGFNAYSPYWVNLTVGGTTYAVQTYSQDPMTGFTVALFDKTSMFSVELDGSLHVASGFLQNPPADGAGIISDWTDSTPNFLVSNPVSATYTAADWYGVGFGAGPCPVPPPGPGGLCEPLGTPNTTVPIPLSGGLELTLAQGGLNQYDLNLPSNYAIDPVDYPNPTDFPFTASLTVVPEPSTWATLLVGFAGLGYLGLRLDRKARLAV